MASKGWTSARARPIRSRGIKFCIDENDAVGIERRCDTSASSEIGTVLVGVEAKEFRTDCDGYGLNIFATYGTESPSSSDENKTPHRRTAPDARARERDPLGRLYVEYG